METPNTAAGKLTEQIMAELLRWYVDCSDDDLRDIGLLRSDLLHLARVYETQAGGEGTMGWEDRQQAVKSVIAAYKEGKIAAKI